MLSTLLGKVVDNVGDVAKRMADGSITKSEGLKEIALAVNSLEGKVVEGQTSLNMEDAKSGDKFRTRWRPAACWMIIGAIALVLYPLIVWALLYLWGWVEAPSLERLAGLAALMEPLVKLLVPLLTFLGMVMGIREGGKAFGNK